MSEIINVNQTNNQAHFDYDTSKIFIWENRYENVVFNNDTGAVLSLPAGTLLGRITADGKVKALASGSTDGSQIPLGILATDVIDLADGTDIEVNVCVSGDVATEKVLLDGTDTLDTNIDGRPIRDRIGSDTVGIKLVAGTELTEFDNQ